MDTFTTAEVAEIRKQFPALHEPMNGKPLAYLDNAATTQKPASVLTAMEQFYRTSNANIHRGVYELSHRATELYEGARVRTQKFLNAGSEREIIFTKSCTEAINLVAHSWGGANLKRGDEVLVSTMEHHSNIVPWQLIAERTGSTVRPIPINDLGEIDLPAFDSLLNSRVKMVAVSHVSNALGTVNPIASIIQKAHGVGAKVLIDGAQAIAHTRVDVTKLDIDFYCMSGHKFYGPTGTGVLYGNGALLDTMPPYQGGGDMIRTVSFEGTTYDEIPRKFEAGTQNIAGVVGLGAALEFLEQLDATQTVQHENALARRAEKSLSEITGIKIIGTAKEKGPIVSFVLEGIHPHDIGTVLDHEGIAVRTGHHCCMPLMRHYSIPGTTRASFAVYNTEVDVDRLIAAVKKASEVFRER